VVQVEHFLVYQQVFLDGGKQGQGMSNIVYSSSICLSEAIDKANRLKADMKSIRTHACVSASLLGWWKQIDRMHFHALTSEVPRSLF
jgi:hypothetical protein